MKVSNLIFDLDGTLIDSAPSILSCMEKVVVNAGYQPVLPLHMSLIGPPLMTTLFRITGVSDETLLQPLVNAFKADYDGEGFRSTQPYPEVPNMLRRLHASGARLHLATNKRAQPTRLILELLGWSELFLSVYSQDRVTPGYANKSAMLEHQLQENNIDPATTVYIGDTREDGLAAAANGLHFIAIDWGYGSFGGWSGVASWSRVATPSALMDELGMGLIPDEATSTTS